MRETVVNQVGREELDRESTEIQVEGKELRCKQELAEVNRDKRQAKYRWCIEGPHKASEEIMFQ